MPSVSATATSDQGSPACQELESRDVGGGLSTAVPVDAVDVGGGATANPGPIPAAFSAEFEVDGEALSVGRWMTPPDVDEADVAERDDGGATLFVKSPDPALRVCVLAATDYDAAADRRD